MTRALPINGQTKDAPVAVAEVDRSTVFCRTKQPEEPVIQYDVSKPCNDTGVNVEANNSYRLTFVVRHPKAGDDVWHNASIPSVFEGTSSWRGWGHPLESAKLVAAAPFRGIVPARWLQPLYAIREKDGPDADRLGDRIFVAKLPSATARSYVKNGRRETAYSMDVTAQYNGRLFLFANDLGVRWFYDNNSGTADVTIENL